MLKCDTLCRDRIPISGLDLMAKHQIVVKIFHSKPPQRHRDSSPRKHECMYKIFPLEFIKAAERWPSHWLTDRHPQNHAWLKRDKDKAMKRDRGLSGWGSEWFRWCEACSYFILEQIHRDNNEQLCALLIFQGSWSAVFFFFFSKHKRLVYLPAQRQSQPCHAFIPYFPFSLTRRQWCESHCSPAFNICRRLRVEILARTAEPLYPSSSKPCVRSYS